MRKLKAWFLIFLFLSDLYAFPLQYNFDKEYFLNYTIGTVEIFGLEHETTVLTKLRKDEFNVISPVFNSTKVNEESAGMAANLNSNIQKKVEEMCALVSEPLLNIVLGIIGAVVIIGALAYGAYKIYEGENNVKQISSDFNTFEKDQKAWREANVKALEEIIINGYGFDDGDTQSIENENRQLKIEIKDNTPLHILVPQLKDKQINIIKNFAKAVFQKLPVSLRDPTKFLGTVKFAALTNDQKRKSLKRIGIKYSEELPSFAEYSPSFPQEFAPKTTEKDRIQLTDEAGTYSVTPHPSTNNAFIVIKDAEIKIVTIDEKVKCQCKAVQRGALICVHIVAVNQKNPNLKIYDIIKNFKENETLNEKMDRETQKDEGAKPGTTRREGKTSTRNTRKAPITRIIDLSVDPPLASSAGPSVAPFSPSSSNSSSAYSRKRLNSDTTSHRFASSDVSTSTTSTGSIAKRRVTEVITLDEREEPEIMTMHTPQFNSSNASFETAYTSLSSPNRTPRAPLPSVTPRFIVPPIPRISHRLRYVPPVIHSIAPTVPQQNILRPALPQNVRIQYRLPNVPQANQQQAIQKAPIPIANYAKDDKNTKDAYMSYYAIQQPIPLHANYCFFVLREAQSVPNAATKKCNECFRHLPPIVVGHFENYTYTDRITRLPVKAAAIRFICASANCVSKRYPYAKRNCFKSDLSNEVTQQLLNEFGQI